MELEAVMGGSSEEMRRVVYVSTAVSLNEGDVALIVEHAQRNNQRNGISGFLLYNGQSFLQLLEGPTEALRALMLRLKQDNRHSGIIILENNDCVVPCFPGWAMRQLRLVETLSERHASIEAALPSELDPAIRQLALNFAILN
jgi:hypothetical protein